MISTEAKRSASTNYCREGQRLRRLGVVHAFAIARLSFAVFSCLQLWMTSADAISTDDSLTPLLRAQSARRRASGIYDEGNDPQRPNIQQGFVNRWHTRLGHPRGGYIFLKHIRKAGGTTLRTYLADVMIYHEMRQESSANVPIRRGGNVSYFEQEFFSMDHHCPDIDPRWNDTLSIIALRHPIERHISEFFYSGPGAYGELARLHHEKEYDSEEFSRRIRESFPAWIEEGIAKNRRDGSLKRHFSDNFQTRALSGSTKDTPYAYDGMPQNECSQRKLINGKLERNEGVYSCINGCDAPCVYGGAGGTWQRGVSAGHRIGKEEQLKAMKVLESFDVVLLTETMGEEMQAEFVADVMGVPLANASIAGLHMKAKPEANSVSNERHYTYQEIVQRTAPEVLEVLEHHSRFEMDLYKHAVSLNGKMIKEWKLEKEKALK
mmetsp:Transcript_63285/g.187091  ORF Transcript_63285/g.187091 Transcript_63285/m.187091 type:complete len:436 (-) Transcript_63285:29-1336(-)|eukprot:CAMPEP_0113547844 /NCGR_PEP_ID=MMETSP0015_2-20120614/12578_1 /TAXON_ID=2838 /ORGANISM="Odontella" /LENGTH=435 /DNA_ID=CAMNT_0000448437 /DNA_START=60 /DNA_END=1367 /DNA_ORIENTATION=+ /assembly_acc=CAM_ASM_000160